MTPSIKASDAVGASDRAMPSWRIPLFQHRFSILLAALVLLLLLSPVMSEFPAGTFLINCLFTLVMLAAVFTASNRPGNLLVALVFAIPWVYLSWVQPLWQADPTQFVTDLLLLGLALFVLVLVLGSVLRAPKVDFDGLCGAVAVYLLIGVVWAVCYRLIEAQIPGSFQTTAIDPAAAWTESLYFSLVTLSTLGYGDVTPISAVARIWSALEAVTGTLYLTVLIARLVGDFSR